MSQTKPGFMAVTLLALVLAGCQSGRFGPANNAPAPAPINPAPAGNVTRNQLPPPSGPSDTGGATQFPEAPRQSQTEGTQMAAADPQGQAAAANAPAISAGSVAGVWSVDVAGQSCRVATPQTKFGSGYRAGPLRCPAPMDGVKSWNVEGKQLAFYDESGGVLARLYSSGEGRFDGQTASGQPISLSR